MAWLEQFLLGRPGTEVLFEVNPDAMAIDEQPIAVLQRNLVGDLKKSIIKTSAPIIRINSNFLSLSQRNQFASLVGISDTFLSFQTRDDWGVVSERDAITDLSHVTLQNNSATRLSAALADAGYDGIITVTGVDLIPNSIAGPLFDEGGFGSGGFSGPDYITGGTYDDATRVYTLGTSLPVGTEFVYVSYTYKGWLVNMEQLNHSFAGGYVNRFTYDFQLTGA